MTGERYTRRGKDLQPCLHDAPFHGDDPPPWRVFAQKGQNPPIKKVKFHLQFTRDPPHPFAIHHRIDYSGNLIVGSTMRVGGSGGNSLSLCVALELEGTLHIPPDIPLAIACDGPGDSFIMRLNGKQSSSFTNKDNTDTKRIKKMRLSASMELGRHR